MSQSIHIYIYVAITVVEIAIRSHGLWAYEFGEHMVARSTLSAREACPAIIVTSQQPCCVYLSISPLQTFLRVATSPPAPCIGAICSLSHFRSLLRLSVHLLSSFPIPYLLTSCAFPSYCPCHLRPLLVHPSPYALMLAPLPQCLQ